MLTHLNTPNSHIAAFIDIGTNSIRLLVARVNPNHAYTVLTEQKEVVRLGEGEFVDQHLQQEAMDRAVLVCRKFVELAHTYGDVPEMCAVATSATREADNREEFLERLRREVPLDAHVISGREEARLIYLGVSRSEHLGDRKALFVDIGGGSTEISVGDQQEYQYLDSLKLGAIRLANLFQPDPTGPVSPELYREMQEYISNAAVRSVQRLCDYRVDMAYGTSGTIENLAEVAARNVRKDRTVRNGVLTFKELERVVKLLCALPLEERRQVAGLNPDRADIIISGAAILHTLMAELKLQEIHVNSCGLRDGMLVEHLSRSDYAHMLEEMSVRARSVLQLGRICAFDEAHARHVARLTVELFDSARELGLHNYGERERELLDYAALLHDVGLFLSFSNHHAHSYYFINNADLLGFDQTETAIMAAAAFFHRRTFPRKKHPEYAALETHSREIVRTFAVLLRIAESLDRNHAGIVQSVRLKKDGKSTIVLEISAERNPHLEIWGVQNHADAFKRVFGKRLILEPRVPETADR